jgi:hypothetical protein
MNPSMTTRNKYSSSSESNEERMGHGSSAHRPNLSSATSSFSSDTSKTSTTMTMETPMKGSGGAEPNAAQALEYKLHATAASFRQSRDTAHRNHQMAKERSDRCIPCNSICSLCKRRTTPIRKPMWTFETKCNVYRMRYAQKER